MRGLLVPVALMASAAAQAPHRRDQQHRDKRVFGFNNDDWFENVGRMPTDERYVLNVSGFFALPWQFQMGFSVSAYSRRRLRRTCRASISMVTGPPTICCRGRA